MNSRRIVRICASISLFLFGLVIILAIATFLLGEIAGAGMAIIAVVSAFVIAILGTLCGLVELAFALPNFKKLNKLDKVFSIIIVVLIFAFGSFYYWFLFSYLG